jgi:putative transposase
MARGKKHTAEQIVNLQRQVEVGVANGKTLAEACKEANSGHSKNCPLHPTEREVPHPTSTK